MPSSRESSSSKIIKSLSTFQKLKEGKTISICISDISVIRIISGKADCDFGDGKELVSDGDCIFVPPQITALITPVTDTAVNNFLIDSSILTEASLCSVSRINRDDPVINSIVDRIEYEYSHQESFHEVYLNSLSKKLIIHLLRKHSQTVFDGATEVSEDARRTLVTKASGFISENSTKGISAKDVAKHLNVSLAYLDRCFKSVLGKTPTMVITELKCRKATETLDRGVKSVTDVAFDNGFASVEHFIRQYKKYSGQTPGQKMKDAKRRQSVTEN